MRSRRISTLGWLTIFSVVLAAPLEGSSTHGKLAGVVIDPSGTPQMGASLWIYSEAAHGAAPFQVFTNQRGAFSTDRLLPGTYSVRVTLAGFLPAIERHVRVHPNLTTILNIELDSVFSSLDRLRRSPGLQPAADDWAWVLRTSPGTRAVLRWGEGEVLLAGDESSSEVARKHKPHGRLELTSGARRPGSIANLADAASSAFAYEQAIGPSSRLLFAGQVSYEHSPAGGFVTMWLPSGDSRHGSQTTLLVRQAKPGPGGPSFRGLRLNHTDQVSLGGRVALRYSAEYILEGVDHSTSALHPYGELRVHLSPGWQASLMLATRPGPRAEPSVGALPAALAELDSLPALMLRNGRPVLEGGWHEELAVEHALGPNTSLATAVFHDRSHHTAIFGVGGVAGPDYLRDFFSDALIYDGGASSSWGSRVVYRQKFSHDVETAIVYAWAGVLAAEDVATNVNLRDALETRHRHSLAARVSSRVPRLGTQFVASYKWISGQAASRQDAFGEVAYQLDPNFNLMVRQPLPNMFFPGKFEALADFHNLLAQGYLPISTRDGRMVLMPAQRSFRGGLSFQF